jgi:hypothetical protein
MDTDNVFTMTAVGAVKQENGTSRIEAEERFRTGLAGLDEFSRVMVLWLFDRAPWDGRTLTTPPCYRKLDHQLGLFATRGSVPYRDLPACRWRSVRIARYRSTPPRLKNLINIYKNYKIGISSWCDHVMRRLLIHVERSYAA